MPKSYLFTLTNVQLGLFLDKIKDLVSINTEVNLRVDSKNTLIYSLVGERRQVTAFKNFIFDTGNLFVCGEDFADKTVKYIIQDGKRFNTTLRNFLDFEEDLTCEFFMNDDIYADNMVIKNSKLKLSLIGGDPQANESDIDADRVKELADIKLANLNFKLDQWSFDKIKKMSRIETEENDIYTLTIVNKSLSIADHAWELKLCDIESEDLSVTFPKKFFNAINFANQDSVIVYVFDTFLFVDNKNTSLLISLELTV